MVYRPEGVKMNGLMQLAGAIGMLLAAQAQGPARPGSAGKLESASGRGGVSGGTCNRSASLCLPSRSGSKVWLGVQGARSGTHRFGGEKDCASFRRTNLE